MTVNRCNTDTPIVKSCCLLYEFITSGYKNFVNASAHNERPLRLSWKPVSDSDFDKISAKDLCANVFVFAMFMAMLLKATSNYIDKQLF